MLFCLLGLAGCGQSKTLPGNVVAKVNNYSITAEELEQEIAAAWPILQNFPGLPPAELKARVLDGMITNQLLIEEAQKLNVDKEPAFMRKIEKDWRQELMKSMFAKKNAEFLPKVPVTEADLLERYERETEELELDLVSLSDEAAARELSSASADTFEATVAKLGAKVISRDKPALWSAGDLSEKIEEKLWSLPNGKVSPPIGSPEEGWIVARVLAREKVTPPPFEAMRDILRRRIVRNTLSNRMDLWIGELRGRAKILTFPKAIEKVPPGVVSRAGESDEK